jgi:acetoin utilization protein AcuB
MRHPKRAIRRAIRTRNPRQRRREAEELQAADWPESIRVEDRMTTSPLTVGWSAKLTEAVRLMRERKIRHLPVLDDGDRLVGIVTDRDLRQVILDPRILDRLSAGWVDRLEEFAVRDVMSWAVVSVRPGASIRDAARLMYQRKIGALPVVKNDRLVGILTETDVIRTFTEVLSEGVISRPYRWALRAP